MQIKKYHHCAGHQAAIYTLAKGKDANHVLTAGGDGWVVEWDTAAPDIGQLLAKVEGQLFSMSHLVDQALIVVGDMRGGLYWIDRNAPTNTKSVQEHQHGIFDILPLGSEQLLTAGGDGVVIRWSIVQKRPLESLQLSNKSLRCLALSSDEKLLAIGSSDGSIYLLDADSFQVLNTIVAAHLPSVFTLSFSPDGKYLYSGGRDAMLRIWDIWTTTPLQLEVPAHLYTVNHLAFSPNGRLFATASRDKTFKLWDTETNTLVKVVDTMRHGSHINSVNRLLWVHDGLLATCSDDRAMMLWEITL